MTVTITPQALRGAITPPPSKSQAHRLLIAAALAGGDSRVERLAQSQDIDATSRSMSALIGGGGDILDCGESGSTLRFLIPIALALRGEGRFTGHGRLMERPQQPYFDLFDEKGISYTLSDGLLTVRGRLTAGSYALPGGVSSQFITGLLYALPLLEGDSEIVLTSPLESRGYVDMTVEALSTFGITVRATAQGYLIPGGQRYVPAQVSVEPDWSQSGFWYAAAALGSAVTVTGMNPNSLQGDRVVATFVDTLAGMAEASIDVSGCPDLVPPLAVWAALRRQATTNIVNAARLRIKESDRLAAVTSELRTLGADVTEGPDFLTIQGVDALRGGVCQSHNDHRIAMMLAIAATRAAAPVTIIGAECVNKSYPNFWEDYAALGGKFEVLP